ncbi:hypothetical protein BD769DRAFT_1384696 [Suillus cothurnatus]|nr:hypothetical protein BD769DRAFT_1384696 [Suillus cothurnatus]
MSFRLCGSVLSSNSQTFNDMLSATETAGLEEMNGKSDERPIRLDGTMREMFELFLEHTFGRAHIGQYTIEELSNFLHFCNMYQCSHTQNFIVSHIQSTRYHFHPAQLINLAVWYNTTLEEHHHIVAAEEPKILMHTNDCQDPVGYNEDWHTIWWNGMAHFLLDGQNPQPYCEAIKCFKDLQFRHVSGGCKELMFKIIREGTTFNHADRFINEACNCLAEKLIFDSLVEA